MDARAGWLNETQKILLPHVRFLPQKQPTCVHNAQKVRARKQIDLGLQVALS